MTDLTQGMSYYYTQDALGSVRTLSDASGAVVNSYDYTAFGESYSQGTVETVANRYQYTGRETSAVVGAPMYYRYRSYSPELGRFSRRDPAGYPNNLQGNLYDYVYGRPGVMVDPYGLWGWTNVMGAVKAVGGSLEVAVGVSLGVATSWTGVGAVAGGAVALHGVDTAVAGFRQAWSGEETDTLTSQVMQIAGMKQDSANLVDSGISVVGSLGAGLVSATLKGVQSKKVA